MDIIKAFIKGFSQGVSWFFYPENITALIISLICNIVIIVSLISGEMYLLSIVWSLTGINAIISYIGNKYCDSNDWLKICFAIYLINVIICLIAVFSGL